MVVSLTGCSRLIEQRSVRMYCESPTGSIESAVVLMAQAVPSAALVPCVNVYPAGWTLGTFDAKSGLVVITFDSDRGGAGALSVTFEAACTPEGTTLPSDEVGAPNLKQKDHQPLGSRYRATRYYSFPGGCMLYTFDFPPGSATTLTTDAAQMVHLTQRSAIEDDLAKFGLQL
jgi:hypothetical protein